MFVQSRGEGLVAVKQSCSMTADGNLGPDCPLGTSVGTGPNCGIVAMNGGRKSIMGVLGGCGIGYHLEKDSSGNTIRVDAQGNPPAPSTSTLPAFAGSV